MSEDKKVSLDDVLQEVNRTLGEKGTEKKKEQKAPSEKKPDKKHSSSKKQKQDPQKAQEKEKDEDIIPQKIVAVEEETSPKTPVFDGEKAKIHRTKRQNKIAAFGLVLAIFAMIGLVFTVCGVANWTGNIVNNTAQKKELERYIYPLVIVDTPEFDNPTSLDSSVVISSAIWSFLTDEKNNKDKYTRDSMGEMRVPDVDIEPYVRKLYGNKVKIVHQMADDTNGQMLYDAQNKYYLIESTPQFVPYTPRVDQIVKKNDIYTLIVSYLLPDVTWNLDTVHKNPMVDKVMQYRLQKTKNGYQILSVKLLKVHSQENASSEPATATGSAVKAPIS